MFRAYRDEVPPDLLSDADLEPDWVRVAKLEGEVIGAYALRPLSPVLFRIEALAVAPRYRRQGLGGWLLRHAVGVCETKGAQQIVAPRKPGTTLCARLGFEPDGDLLRLRLTPE